MNSIKIEINKATNECTISSVDERGNGIILLSGKIGGCTWLNNTEQRKCIETLVQLDIGHEPARG